MSSGVTPSRILQFVPLVQSLAVMEQYKLKEKMQRTQKCAKEKL